MPIKEEVIKKIKEKVAEGKSYVEALEEISLSSYRENEKKKYLEIKPKLMDFKGKLEAYTNFESVSKKAEKILSGKAVSVNYNPEELFRIINIALERKELVLNTFEKMLKRELILDDNLKKYIISNFHRSLSEVTLKIFSEPLFSIIDYLEKEIPLSQIINDEDKIDKLSKLKRWKTELEKDKLGLDAFLEIIGNLEKYTPINAGICEIIADSLSHEDNGGFITRNDTAHERKLFTEIDSKDLSDRVMKVDIFNIAFLNVFYISDINGQNAIGLL